MFIITGKIGNQVCTIKCDDIKNRQPEYEDEVFIFDDLIFSGHKLVIDKMLKENAIDHGYVGMVPSGCEWRENYLSGGLSAYGLLYNVEDDWEWKKFSKDVVF